MIKSPSWFYEVGMRIALCLTGKAGTKSKWALGEQTLDLAKIGFKHFKENLIDLNNVDVFLHCWDTEFKEELVDMYNPKGYVFQKQIHFQKFQKLNIVQFCTKSKAYSNKRCLQTVKKYEQKYNFAYDAIILSRFDLALQRKIILSEEGLDLQKFYHNGPDPLHTYSPEICIKVCCDPNNFQQYCIGDLFFVSNSENMHIFSQLYDSVDSYNLNSFHICARMHIEKTGLQRDTFLECRKSNYQGYRGIQDGEVPLVRWAYDVGANPTENT